MRGIGIHYLIIARKYLCVNAGHISSLAVVNNNRIVIIIQSFTKQRPVSKAMLMIFKISVQSVQFELTQDRYFSN